MSAIEERHKACPYPDSTTDYLVLKTVKGVGRSRTYIDQRQLISLRDLSLIITSIPLSKCSSNTVVFLRAIVSLMFFGFLRVSEVTASPHNFSVR